MVKKKDGLISKPRADGGRREYLGNCPVLPNPTLRHVGACVCSRRWLSPIGERRANHRFRLSDPGFVTGPVLGTARSDLSCLPLGGRRVEADGVVLKCES